MFRKNWFDEMFERMERMQREIERAFSPLRPLGEWGVFPPINIYDDGESYIARAELPGVDPNHIEITVAGNSLTISGRRELEKLPEGAAWHRRERQGGEFRRAFTLPDAVDSSKVVASSKNGVLEIVLPRAEQAKMKKIPVKSA
jgi:HSP20 family protein